MQRQKLPVQGVVCMKAILIVLAALLVVAACAKQAPTTPPPAQSPAVSGPTDLANQLQDVDSLDKDLNLSDLDSLDADLNLT
jgi:hypothetical protein